MTAPLSALSLTLISSPGEGQHLIVDGLTPLQALLDATPHTPPLLQDLLQLGEITWQYRNETTVASALSGGAPAIPWLVGLAAWGGAVLLSDDQEIPTEAYLARKAGARRAEGLRIPVKRENRTWGEAHVSITPSDRPIVLAVAMLEWDGETIASAGMAIHGVSKQGVLVIPEIETWVGASQPDTAALAEQAAAHFAPRSDFRASAEYRHEMGKVVIRRALEQALTGEKA